MLFVMVPQQTASEKRKRSTGLLVEMFGQGVAFDSLTTEQRRRYHNEWKARNKERRAERDRELRLARSERQRADPEWVAKRRAYQKEYSEKNRHRYAAYYRRYRLKSEYGLTADQYNALVEAQQGKCAICRSVVMGNWHGRLCVDHCHRTGIVRGLLCHSCNVLIGHANDDESLLRRAISYLRKQGANADVVRHDSRV